MEREQHRRIQRILDFLEMRFRGLADASYTGKVCLEFHLKEGHPMAYNDLEVVRKGKVQVQ